MSFGRSQTLFLSGFLSSLLPIQIALCSIDLGQTKSDLIEPFLRQARLLGCGPTAVSGSSSLYYCCHWVHWVPPNCHNAMCCFGLIPPNFHFSCQCQAEMLLEERWRSGKKLFLISAILLINLPLLHSIVILFYD